jgi:hypothetical protein
MQGDELVLEVENGEIQGGADLFKRGLRLQDMCNMITRSILSRIGVQTFVRLQFGEDSMKKMELGKILFSGFGEDSRLEMITVIGHAVTEQPPK